MRELELVVQSIRTVSPLIKEITLCSATANPLPPFEAGSHLKVSIPTLSEHRCYSLIVTNSSYNWSDFPQNYTIGVKLETEGNGGSKYMHQLKEGDTLYIQDIKNDFPLALDHDQNLPTILIAGGIGITPIVSIAHYLKKSNIPFTLYYSAQAQEHLAFLPEIENLFGDKIKTFTNNINPLSLEEIFKCISKKQQIYVCGPKGMIDTCIDLIKTNNLPSSNLHFELFSSATAQAGDKSFQVELKQSGITLTVPEDKTILEILEENGIDVIYDCNRGECGVCSVSVLEGIPEHRDYFLTDTEKASNKTMQICISRAQTPKLVLDL